MKVKKHTEKPIKSKTHNDQTLADWYGVHADTFRKWIKPIKDQLNKVGKIYTPNQITIIIDYLGEPPNRADN